MKEEARPVPISTLRKKDTAISMVIIGILFFIFGFVTWINAMLIPYFKIACQLNHFQSYLVAFSFYIAYLVMSLPASLILRKWGFKKGMMVGFWAMAAGAFLFIPAGLTRIYGIFLGGLFTIGIGLAILQTAVNPYITLLGPKERAARRFSIMGICNKGAGILAPILFAAVIILPGDAQFFKAIATMEGLAKEQALDGLARRVVVPYAVVGTVLLALGFFLRWSPLPEIATAPEEEISETAPVTAKKTILDFPHLVLGAFAIFFHVGAQVVAVDSVIGYASSSGLSFIEAKLFPSYILTATITGYLLGLALMPAWLSQLTALRICTVLGFIFSCLVLLANGEIHLLGYRTDVSVWFVVLLGFANSMIWAGIWPLALDGLGRFVKTGASLMIMGLCGNAIMPLIYGYWADAHGPRQAYWILLPCYGYLIFYAFYAYRLRRWSPNMKRVYEFPENL